VRPHAQNLYRPVSNVDFVYETMLAIDPARIKAGKIADELLERRWVPVGIVSQNGEQLFYLLLQSRRSDFFRIFLRCLRKDDAPRLTYQSTASEHESSGSAAASRTDSRIPGIESKYNVS